MGRDRNQIQNEDSLEHEEYDEELNFTMENDDLFREDNDDAETVDFEDAPPNKNSLFQVREDKKKAKNDLNKVINEFDREGENLNEKYAETPNFEEDHLEMQKVDLEQLNEEEKYIERSRLNEQKKLLEEFEDDRMDLLNMERKEEDRMKYASSVMTNELLLEENRATIEVRENEARTFRSFAKKEEHLKVRILNDEGELVNMKKELRFKPNKARSHLFGGSRDKVIGLRWNQTPTPLEVKILMARKVNEKLDRANYALNVTILDGFGGNEIFFKFSKDMINDDYRDKLVRMVKRKEKEAERESRDESKHDSSDSDEDAIQRRNLQAPQPANKNPQNTLDFLKKTLKRLENDNENYKEQSQVDFDNESIHSFLMPDVNHRRQRREELHINDTVAKMGDTTLKKDLIGQFKQVLLNFQKNFSSLQRFDQPLEDEELEFENKVYFMIPHEHIIEPSYIIMFELILLDEKLSSTSDRVVAWGAYPLINRG